MRGTPLHQRMQGNVTRANADAKMCGIFRWILVTSNPTGRGRKPTPLALYLAVYRETNVTTCTRYGILDGCAFFYLCLFVWRMPLPPCLSQVWNELE